MILTKTTGGFSWPRTRFATVAETDAERAAGKGAFVVKFTPFGSNVTQVATTTGSGATSFSTIGAPAANKGTTPDVVSASSPLNLFGLGVLAVAVWFLFFRK